jgi:hypothetical protein
VKRIAVGAVLALAMVASGLVAQTVERRLLEPHAILAAEAQLDSDESGVIGHEQVELVRNFQNCALAIRDALTDWLDQLKLVPSRTLVLEHQVRFVVDVDTPRRGLVVINYRFIGEKKRALLEMLFDSGASLSAQEIELVVKRYDLMSLRQTLVRRMNCGV